MKTRRITLHVFLVLVTVTVAALWTTRSHANSHPIVASFDEAPMVVYEGEQPNNTGEPDGGQIKPPVKPLGSAISHEGLGLTRSDLLQLTWMYWRAVIGGFAR